MSLCLMRFKPNVIDKIGGGVDPIMMISIPNRTGYIANRVSIEPLLCVLHYGSEGNIHHSLRGQQQDELLYFIQGHANAGFYEPASFRSEMIKVAALAIAAIESYDRKNTSSKET